jgi:hypothetical protein
MKLHKTGLHTKYRSEEDEIRPVRLKGSGQTFWLEFGRYRDDWAVPSVEGMVETQQQDVAILAALTVSEAELTDIERLSRDVLPRVKELLESGECTSMKDAFRSLSIPWPGEVSRDASKLRDYWEPLLRSREFYITLLLEHFRPDLNSYPPDKQIELFKETCKQVNAFLRASRQLTNFLEYGAPNRDTRPEVENVVRDARAAVLRDGGGLTHRQIGEVLDVPLTAYSRLKGGHDTVSKMVQRGRTILESAFGEEGWREKAQAIKADAEARVEQVKEVCVTRTAEVIGEPIEDVRPHVRLNPRTGLPELDEEYEAKFKDNIVEYVEKISSKYRAERRDKRAGTQEEGSHST